MMTLIETILGIISTLVSRFFGSKDERDVSTEQGEKTGVAETQAATAQQTVKEAANAQRTDEDVRDLSDKQLNDELRDGS